MALVIRRPDDPSFEVEVGDKPLSLGTDADSDVRLAGDGIAGSHLVISGGAIEARADVEVGGVRLRAGRRRLCVPSVVRLGGTTLVIVNAEESWVATRELVLRGLAGLAGLAGTPQLWPRILIVEGPSSGRELTLQTQRPYAVGRDPRSDLAVDDPQMSRAHFEVEHREGSVFVRALGSTSAVWLGGAALEPRRKATWPAHRMVRAGASVFAFVAPPGLAEQRSTPVPAPIEADAAPEAVAIEVGMAALDTSTSTQRAEGAAAAEAGPDEVVLSTGGAPPLPRVDDVERSHAPVPVDAHVRYPWALRVAFILFVFLCLSSLVTLAYSLIF